MRAILMCVALLAVSCGGGGSVSRATAAPPTFVPATLAAPPTAAPAQCAAVAQTAAPTKATIELVKGGTIVFMFHTAQAPLTVANFAKKATACFYDGLIFHRVIGNFMAQGGDPLGTGTGGGQIPTELSDLPFIKGAVGVARGGDIKVSNDAQFFIVNGEARHLDKQYTNFGQVITGQDVVDGIKIGDKIKTIRVS